MKVKMTQEELRPWILYRDQFGQYKNFRSKQVPELRYLTDYMMVKEYWHLVKYMELATPKPHTHNRFLEWLSSINPYLYRNLAGDMHIWIL